MQERLLQSGVDRREIIGGCFMIEAHVICDSISEQGHRLTTYKLRYPKFVHGEFMTHRVISRNASSSRAIPTAKLIEEVRSDALRAAPVFWGRNQKGMQAAEELSEDQTPEPSNSYFYRSGKTEKQAAQELWATAAYHASRYADLMVQIGVHKQIVNRLLEPFSHINVVATATEWDNFFGLRLHKDAQPEIRALAIAMWEARKASTPKLLRPGEWHLPFVGQVAADDDIHIDKQSYVDIGTAIKVSVARCARVSYELFETGKRSTVEEDLKLYDRLLGAQPLHASPAEHQGTPDQFTEWGYYWVGNRQPTVNEVATKQPENGDNKWERAPKWFNQNEHHNFRGWRQFRAMLPGEAVAPIPEEFR